MNKTPNLRKSSLVLRAVLIALAFRGGAELGAQPIVRRESELKLSRGNFKAGAELLQKECEVSGIQRSCVVWLQAMILGMPSIPQNMKLAVGLADIACQKGELSGCGAAADFFHDRLLQEGRDVAPAYQLHERNCVRNFGRSCSTLGEYVHKRGFGDSAMVLFRRGCDLKDQMGCNDLGYIADSVGQRDSARRYYSMSCSETEGTGCSNLGMRLLTLKVPTDSEIATAIGYFARACFAMNSRGCGNLEDVLGFGSNLPYNADPLWRKLAQSYLKEVDYCDGRVKSVFQSRSPKLLSGPSERSVRVVCTLGRILPAAEATNPRMRIPQVVRAAMQRAAEISKVEGFS